MVIVLYQLKTIWVNLDTKSGQDQVKMSYFESFNFGKRRHVSNAGCPQESNCAFCFSLSGLELQKIAVTFYCVTSPLYVPNVIESNLAFGVHKFMYRFEILHCG